MKIRDILKVKGSHIASILPDRPVQEAIEVLVGNNIGSLLVLESDHLKGVITERDVLRLCARRGDALGQVLVREVMSSDLIIATPEDDVKEIMAIMTARRIRHLPVLDAGRLVGVVSIGDIVKSQLDESVYEVRYLREYISGSGAAA